MLYLILLNMMLNKILYIIKNTLTEINSIKVFFLSPIQNIFIFLLHKVFLLFLLHSLLGFQSLEKLRVPSDGCSHCCHRTNRTCYRSASNCSQHSEARNSHSSRQNRSRHSVTQARNMFLFQISYYGNLYHQNMTMVYY